MLLFPPHSALPVWEIHSALIVEIHKAQSYRFPRNRPEMAACHLDHPTSIKSLYGIGLSSRQVEYMLADQMRCSELAV